MENYIIKALDNYLDDSGYGGSTNADFCYRPSREHYRYWYKIYDTFQRYYLEKDKQLLKFIDVMEKYESMDMEEYVIEIFKHMHKKQKKYGCITFEEMAIMVSNTIDIITEKYLRNYIG